MDEYIFKQGILRLDAHQARLVYLRCKEGLSTRQMADELDEDINNINRWLYGAYHALHIDGIHELNDTSCRWFYEVAGDPPDWDNWPPDFTPTTNGQREEVRPRWVTIAAAIVILVGIGYLGFLVLGDDDPPPSPEDEDAIAIGPPTTESGTQGGAQDEEPAQQQDPPTETLTPAVTPPASPTPSPSYSPTPSRTPSPTSTSTVTPTPTSTPEPTAITQRDFYDDLSDGIDEEIWNIHFGDYEVVNGKTEITDPLYMTLGDETWQDYEITTKIIRSSGGVTRGNYICVRCGDDYGVGIAFASIRWPRIWLQENGEWESFQRYEQLAGGKTLRISVEGDNIQAWMNEDIFLDYVTDFESGEIGIRFHTTTELEWIEVTRLD